MTFAIRTAERRAGINVGKLQRLQRDVETHRAKLRGVSTHRMEATDRRRDLRARLNGNLEARHRIEGAHPGVVDWVLAPEIGLSSLPEGDLRAVGIDPDDVADCLVTNEEIADLGRELATLNHDLDQRSALLARLEEYAHGN